LRRADGSARNDRQSDAVDAGQPARLVKAGNAVDDSLTIGEQQADAGVPGGALTLKAAPTVLEPPTS